MVSEIKAMVKMIGVTPTTNVKSMSVCTDAGLGKLPPFLPKKQFIPRPGRMFGCVRVRALVPS